MSNKTLIELFDDYSQNPRQEWITHYRRTCGKVQLIVEGKERLDIDFAKYLWTERANGISGIGNYGLVTKDEFEKLKNIIINFTNDIFKDSSINGYKKILKKWDIFKAQGVVTRNRFAPINRVFAAAAPRIYSSVVNVRYVNRLIDYLNQKHSFSITKKGDWSDKNSQLLKKIIEYDDIFRNADPIILNTFIWWLYSTQIKSPETQSQETKVTQPMNLATAKPKPPLDTLNTIFYGPPGTGKTYRIQQLKEQYTTKTSNLTPEQWTTEIIGDLPWWKIIAAALHLNKGKATVPEIREHPLVKAKLNISDNRNPNQTLWLNLQVHTVEDSQTVKYTKRRPPYIFDKKADSVWELQEGWKDICEDVLRLAKMFSAKQPPDQIIKRYEFITFHQSYSYEEFIEGIRPVLKDPSQQEPEEQQSELEYERVDGVFKRICKKALSDPSNTYALFIDEINRGNISKIFGELITLIEDDKRRDFTITEPNGLEIKLPYSQKSFSVPKNLHIIGTMNTADRSLALMDTALRRRFSFVEIMPNPGCLEGQTVTEGSSTVNLPQLLTIMNERIEVLYDREHTLGHAFFKGNQWSSPSIEALKETFEQKIIPLLQEYFFDDWEKIRLVLGDNQKGQKENQFITKSEIDNTRLFGDAETNGFDLNKYEINKDAFDKIESYIQIYTPKQVNQESEA
ncbi:McrB family protein [Desulfovibrio subterraneus]|uniref:AAA+ ATPase domain-containing protein n=1 Tax=Desulfovibrio subterraneus TaxID=2718620 RepID=A0A7J0BJB2_9BACT|nr:AAA family ATPase [Desulfovibrio subterraneus]GFM33719.1 hypothetical protein DSM101010T_20840 [Desulfovibrio subterraneus]